VENEWPPLEHASVRRRVRVQAGGCDGAARFREARYLVARLWHLPTEGKTEKREEQGEGCKVIGAR